MPTSSRSRRHAGAASRLSHTGQLPLFPIRDLELIHLALPVDRRLDHTTTDITIADDGAVVVARCACGGRREILLDLDASAFGTVDNDLIPDDLCRALGAPPPREMARWLSEHRRCATAPRLHTMPAALEGLIEATWQASVEDIAAGRQVADLLYVLLSPAEICALPLEAFRSTVGTGHGLGEPWTGDRLAHAAVRQFICQAGVEPLGVVAVGEAWMAPASSRTDRPSDNPEREEVLMLWAASPDYAVTRIGQIDRASADLTTAGAIRDVSTFPLGTICPPIDGVLASVSARMAV